MSASIHGLGMFLPETLRLDDDWPPSFREQFERLRRDDLTRIDPADDAIGALAQRHAAAHERDPFRGARRRHVVTGTTSSEAGALAARAALADAGISASEVDLVLSHALVPERVSPPDAARIAAHLGIRRGAALGLDAVCASVIAQLVVASAMIESGRARRVLLVQSHVVSPTLDYAQPASAIFGDAATALVVGPGARGEGLRADVASVDGSMHGAVSFERRSGTPWHAAGEAMHPASADRVATHRMTSRLLHFGVDTLGALFDRAHIHGTDVDVLASIQPAAWYPAALAEAVGVPAVRAPSTFDRIAHVGACGVVANLLEARAQGLLLPGAQVVLYAHGAGMNCVAALLRWGQR